LQAQLLVAPFQFRCTPLQPPGSVPALGEMNVEATAAAAREASA
jgi:hypothetical protein